MAILYENMLWVNQGAPPWGITGKISEIQVAFSLLCVTKPEVNAVEVFQSAFFNSSLFPGSGAMGSAALSLAGTVAAAGRFRTGCSTS